MNKKIVFNCEINDLKINSKNLLGVADPDSTELVLRYFLEKNCKVYLLITEKKHKKKNIPSRSKIVQYYNSLGIKTIYFLSIDNPFHTSKVVSHFLLGKIYNFFINNFILLKNFYFFSKKFSNFVKKIEPFFVFSFYEASPPFSFFKTKYVVWASEDGVVRKQFAFDHNIWNPLGFKNSKFFFKVWLFLNGFFYKVLSKKFDLDISPSLYYGKRNRKYFGKKPLVHYFPHPCNDLLLNKNKKFNLNKGKLYRILLVGHLSTTYGRANINFFISEIFPNLIKTNYLKYFRIDIIGKYDFVDERLELILKENKNINLKGYVNDLGSYVRDSNLVLHAIKYPPTSGAKIGSLCSAYAGLLVHEKTKLGFPEIFRSKACESAKNGSEFVTKMMEICNNNKLNFKMKINARKVYEKYYHYKYLNKHLDDSLSLINSNFNQ